MGGRRGSAWWNSPQEGVGVPARSGCAGHTYLLVMSRSGE